MIGAYKARGIALAMFAQGGPAVTATVQHDAHLAVLVAVYNDRLLANMRGHKIARFGQFAIMRNPDPGALEDALLLFFENLGILVQSSMNPVGLHQFVIR
jgi:hypothetical protein